MTSGPVLGPTGDVWIIHQVTGLIEHYSRQGVLLGSAALPERYVQDRIAEFFRLSRKLAADPARMAGLYMVADAVADHQTLWLLLPQADSLPTRLLSIDSTYSVRTDESILGLEGIGAMTLDSVSGAFYMIQGGEGIILRVRRRVVCAA